MNSVMSIHIPRRVWIEIHSDETEYDSCDVIVEMENGDYYNALFVTLPYLRSQMELSYEMSKQIPDTPPVRYTALETPHILVEKLTRDIIEDTIDNLIALDIFETMFTLVMEEDQEDALHNKITRTAEMAAVVINEVLNVEAAPVQRHITNTPTPLTTTAV